MALCVVLCTSSVMLFLVRCRLIMPDKDEEMPGELLKVFPANNLQMMFLSGAKGTQVSSSVCFFVAVLLLWSNLRLGQTLTSLWNWGFDAVLKLLSAVVTFYLYANYFKVLASKGVTWVLALFCIVHKQHVVVMEYNITADSDTCSYPWCRCN